MRDTKIPGNLAKVIKLLMLKNIVEPQMNTNSLVIIRHMWLIVLSRI
jgi:hypothetical protein